MPVSPRTRILNSKPHCPVHPRATVLISRRVGESRFHWICMDCGKRLGDAGPVGNSPDRLAPG